MPNFKVTFTRKVYQYHEAVVEADDLEAVEQMYEDGEIETTVKGEEITDEFSYLAVPTDETLPAEKPAGPPCNADFIHDLMNFGNPMKQLVIMEAIRRYAEDIATEFDPTTAEGGIWNMINPHAWKRGAEEVHKAMKERLG